jgi:hypothetical protein
MAKLTDWLDGEIGKRVKGAAAAKDGMAAGAEAAAPVPPPHRHTLLNATLVSTLSQGAPEEASRSLDLTDAPAGEEGAAISGSGRKSLRKTAFSAVTSLAGGLFGLDGQLPKFEETARELVHPLFEKLKTEVGRERDRWKRGSDGRT